MIHKILAVGDSFTYGEELSDRDNAWPYLVANRINATVDNKGVPAGGNTQIIRNVVSSTMTPDLVLVGLTSPGRVEFADEEGVFDIWPGYNGRWVQHPQRHQLTQYLDKHHSDWYLYQQYLINVILLQSFLKSNNIKYLMMVTMGNEFYKNKFSKEFVSLRNQVDSTYFVDPGNGMAEWTHGMPKGPNRHFLDEGHRAVADKVVAKIKELGWA